MKKRFEIGKISLGGKRKIYPVELEAELRDTPKGPVFAVCGYIYNTRKTDCYSAGQNLETIYKYNKSDTVKKLYTFWKQYHLNDMHAGTERQDALVDEFLASGNPYDYKQVCEYLKQNNLYIDNGYEYGTKWLYREIPASDLEKIKILLSD